MHGQCYDLGVLFDFAPFVSVIMGLQVTFEEDQVSFEQKLLAGLSKLTSSLHIDPFRGFLVLPFE
jgi:hypothetical protein